MSHEEEVLACRQHGVDEFVKMAVALRGRALALLAAGKSEEAASFQLAANRVADRAEEERRKIHVR